MSGRIELDPQFLDRVEQGYQPWIARFAAGRLGKVAGWMARPAGSR